jgi:hypothetical protein
MALVTAISTSRGRTGLLTKRWMRARSMVSPMSAREGACAVGGCEDVEALGELALEEVDEVGVIVGDQDVFVHQAAPPPGK